MAALLEKREQGWRVASAIKGLAEGACGAGAAREDGPPEVC